MKGKQWIPAAIAAAALVMPLSSYAAAAPQGTKSLSSTEQLPVSAALDAQQSTLLFLF